MSPRDIGHRFVALAALDVRTVEAVDIMGSPIGGASTLNVRVPLSEWLGVVDYLTGRDRNRPCTGRARLSHDCVWSCIDMEDGYILSAFWPLSRLHEAEHMLRLLGVAEVDAWMTLAQAGEA